MRLPQAQRQANHSVIILYVQAELSPPRCVYSSGRCPGLRLKRAFGAQIWAWGVGRGEQPSNSPPETRCGRPMRPDAMPHANGRAHPFPADPKASKPDPKTQHQAPLSPGAPCFRLTQTCPEMRARVPLTAQPWGAQRPRGLTAPAQPPLSGHVRGLRIQRRAAPNSWRLTGQSSTLTRLDPPVVMSRPFHRSGGMRFLPYPRSIPCKSQLPSTCARRHPRCSAEKARRRPSASVAKPSGPECSPKE
jgi:hypothetical protein